MAMPEFAGIKKNRKVQGYSNQIGGTEPIEWTEKQLQGRKREQKRQARIAEAAKRERERNAVPRTNRYEGTCGNCGRMVAAGQGYIVEELEEQHHGHAKPYWQVYHNEGDCERTQRTSTSGRTMHDHEEVHAGL